MTLLRKLALKLGWALQGVPFVYNERTDRVTRQWPYWLGVRLHNWGDPDVNDH